MPADVERCTICGCYYKHHRAGTSSCPLLHAGSGLWSSIATFTTATSTPTVSKQVMLKDCPPGSVVMWQGVRATVVSHSTALTLLGWKGSAPEACWEINEAPNEPRYQALRDGGYTHGRWEVDTYLTELISRDATVIQSRPTGGMACSGCGTFNDYAEPNQPDGKTYKCFSCRSRGY